MRARAALLGAALALAGCAERDVEEVRQWMAEVRQQARVAVPPLAEPKAFTPFAYGGLAGADPFGAGKLQVEPDNAARPGGGLKPDLARPRELLENYPLDTMKMVGVLQKGSLAYALLQIDRNVYQVKAGQRLGQNFGQVTGIDEEAVQIREVVQDAAGEWVERMARLELQESKESKK